MEKSQTIMPDGWHICQERAKVYRKLRRRIQPLLDRASFFSRWAIKRRCDKICDRVMSRSVERRWGMSVVTIKKTVFGFHWPSDGLICHLQK